MDAFMTVRMCACACALRLACMHGMTSGTRLRLVTNMKTGFCSTAFSSYEYACGYDAHQDGQLLPMTEHVRHEAGLSMYYKLCSDHGRHLN